MVEERDDSPAFHIGNRFGAVLVFKSHTAFADIISLAASLGAGGFPAHNQNGRMGMSFCHLDARRIRCDRGGRIVRLAVCIGDHAIVIIGALGGCIGREAGTVCAHLGSAVRAAVAALVPLVG